jgi:integrase
MAHFRILDGRLIGQLTENTAAILLYFYHNPTGLASALTDGVQLPLAPGARCQSMAAAEAYRRDNMRGLLAIGFAASASMRPMFGTHSLRRTKATLIYRRTGNLRAVQLLLGHRKIESTVRYLGVEVDDALAIAEQIDV